MKTSSGFEIEIDKNVMDDWLLLKYLREIDKGNVQYVVDAIEKLIGKEGLEKLEKHLLEKFGKISAIQMTNEFYEIITSDELKN